MIPTYRACASESGPGTQARMHALMARKMAARDIFRYLFACVHAECQSGFEGMVGTLRRDVEAVCKEVEGSLGRGTVVVDRGDEGMKVGCGVVREVLEGVRRTWESIGIEKLGCEDEVVIQEEEEKMGRKG